MSKKAKPIPVNNFGGEFNSDIFIERISFNSFPDLEEWSQPERHDRHSFFLLEKGRVKMEIDFQVYEIASPSIIYMHPNQVHRIIAFENVTVTCWAINNENLRAEYLEMLEDITPAKPMLLMDDTFSLISEAISLCINLFTHNQEKLYYFLLKDSCSVLVALVASQYLVHARPAGAFSRFETINKAFKSALEQHFVTLKRPAEYAGMLNISTPYLNECVKAATGYSVSHHIQQRIILEAKRLLYHSHKSVKEITADLGYDDYPYFSRLFAKVAGTTAIAFRNKNLG